MKTAALMLDPAALEAALAKWIAPDHVDAARQEIVFALAEYEELTDAGTLRDQEIAADENLHAIADAAKRLSRALSSMPPRAVAALLEHRNASRQPGLLTKWLADLRAIREDWIQPLGADATAALKYLPKGPGRGRPSATKPQARDALLVRLAAVYASSGVDGGNRGDHGLHGFLRAVADTVSMKLPNDLARVLREAEGKSPGI